MFFSLGLTLFGVGLASILVFLRPLFQVAGIATLVATLPLFFVKEKKF